MFNYNTLPLEKIEFVAIADVDELPNGERIFLEIEDEFIVVFNIDGEYFAIEDSCTHDNGPIGEGELEDHKIVCPRHGARFDVRDGSVKSPPAVMDVKAYPTRVVDGQIEIGIPKE